MAARVSRDNSNRFSIQSLRLPLYLRTRYTRIFLVPAYLCRNTAIGSRHKSYHDHIHTYIYNIYVYNYYHRFRLISVDHRCVVALSAYGYASRAHARIARILV